MAAAIGLRADLIGDDLRRLARDGRDAKQVRRLQALAVIAEGGARTEAAREACGVARGEGRIGSAQGFAAMRAALEKQRDGPEVGEGVGDRLRRMLARDQERSGGEAAREPVMASVRSNHLGKSERGPQESIRRSSREDSRKGSQRDRDRDDGWER